MRRIIYEVVGPQPGATPESVPVRLATLEKFEDLTRKDVTSPNIVKILDLASRHPNNPIGFITSQEELEELRISKERDHAWKPEKAEPLPSSINPSHYQGYLDDLQWLEAMSRLKRYRQDPETFIAAVELQARKYLDRLGGKDDVTQEVGKSLWYLRFLLAYILNDRAPIYVRDIDPIFEKHLPGKTFLDDMEMRWLSAVLGKFETRPKELEGVIELQIRKYIDMSYMPETRAGCLCKAIGYLMFLQDLLSKNK